MWKLRRGRKPEAPDSETSAVNALPRGTVLLDNTTVFGARRAYDAWPIKAEDWLHGQLAIDLRSLMDVLEALILHTKSVLDNSSRGPSSAWEDLTSLTDPGSGASAVHELNLLGAPPEGDVARLTGRLLAPRLGSAQVWQETASALASDALDKVARGVQSGTLEVERRRLTGGAGAPALPPFYSGPGEFEELVTDSFGDAMSANARQRLHDVSRLISRQDAAAANWAFFAFRAYYYLGLAHLACISYVPHTWRTEIIGDELGKRATFRFTDYLMSLPATLRAELAEQLNGEFGHANYLS